MELTLKKWGNSSGIVIPKNILSSLHIENGSKLEIYQEDETIVLKPCKKNRKEELSYMLSQITKENMHQGEIFDTIVGNEKW